MDIDKTIQLLNETLAVNSNYVNTVLCDPKYANDETQELFGMLGDQLTVLAIINTLLARHGETCKVAALREFDADGSIKVKYFYKIDLELENNVSKHED